MELLRCRRGLRFKFFNWLVWGCLAQAVLAAPPSTAAGGITGKSLVAYYLASDAPYKAAFNALGDAMMARAEREAGIASLMSSDMVRNRFLWLTGLLVGVTSQGLMALVRDLDDAERMGAKTIDSIGDWPVASKDFGTYRALLTLTLST